MSTFHKTAETFNPGAKTLPQRYFTSPEIFAEEQERIFTRTWICVGHENQLAHPGDYFVQKVAGESLIFTRDQNRQVHGYYNLCRHRGTRLCENSRGQFSKAIQCPYHAWTYSLAGKLIGAPHMDQIEGFAKSDYPLHAAHVALWEGFIFVNLAPEPEPFEAAFAPLLNKFSQWQMPNLRLAKRIEYDVRTNWKIIFLNYSECYHCPGVHPHLSKLSPYDAAENDLYEGPFLGGYMPIRQSGGSMTMTGNSCALRLRDSQTDDNQVYYYSIFPNMLLSMHPDYVMVHTIWPQTPDRVIVHCDWLFHPDAFGKPDFNPNDAVEFWNMTNRQDWRVCELSQQGMSSRMYRPSPYSPRESVLAAFDREYLRMFARAR